MITGSARFRTPLLFIAGFIFMFVTGGLTGIMFVAIPFDQQVTDTYFVIAHFHYIIFGAAVFPIFGGMYYWFPKVTGKLYFELPGQISFWILFVGTNLLFFPMHIVGLLGMPRRDYTYPDGLGWSAVQPARRRSAATSPRVGILLLLGNLVRQLLPRRARRPRPVARRDARVDDQLAAAASTTSPSSRRCSSAYANWDDERPRRRTARKLAERRAACSTQGHEQPAVTPVDGYARRDRRDAARLAVADRCSRSRCRSSS